MEAEWPKNNFDVATIVTQPTIQVRWGGNCDESPLDVQMWVVLVAAAEDQTDAKAYG